MFCSSNRSAVRGHARWAARLIDRVLSGVCVNDPATDFFVQKLSGRGGVHAPELADRLAGIDGKGAEH